MHLLDEMTEVRDLRMRVGALPRYPSNRLKYNLTWSTEGLINEYCQPCEVILNGEPRSVQPLENLETLTIDGAEYEAFNTSGGLGTLAQTLLGRVRNVNYKSIRYPGHTYLLKFLLKDLQLEQDLDSLREIFERCLPTTFQDQIVIFVSATGQFRGHNTEATYARTIRHQEIDGENWSGIQITTAAGVCAVLDLLVAGELPQRGFVRQEQVSYDSFIRNRFGRHYA
jgi:saccharopine dehydrogenase-like NADP-dependent oxidoreductase